MKTSDIHAIELVSSAMPPEESILYAEVSVAVEQQLGVHCEDVEQAIQTFPDGFRARRACSIALKSFSLREAVMQC